MHTESDNERTGVFVRALDEIQSLIHLRFEDFFWEIKQRFRLCAREKRVHQLNKTIDEYAHHILKGIQVGENKTDNIVTRCMSYCNEQGPLYQQPSNCVIWLWGSHLRG